MASADDSSQLQAPILHEGRILLLSRDSCINFHSEEVKFILDENGKPIDTYIKVQKEANMLIEDFMLLANKTIAESIAKSNKFKDYTFVFRVHDEPNPEKLYNFIQLVSKLGYSMNISSRENLVRSYNSLFNAVDGKGEKNLVETAFFASVSAMTNSFYLLPSNSSNIA